VAGQSLLDGGGLVPGEAVADQVHVQPSGHVLVDPGQELLELRGPVAAVHDKLVRANAYASLHVAEGMWHGFTYQPDLPEAIHARGLVNRFIFDTLTLSC